MASEEKKLKKEKSIITTLRLKPKMDSMWRDHCKMINKSSSEAIRNLIELELGEGFKTDSSEKLFSQVNDYSDPNKTRFEITLTASEKKALYEMAEAEECSMRQWVVDAVRAGLTKEPQFTMTEIKELGESNYQLMMIGRNLNQIAKRINEGKMEIGLLEKIDEIKQKMSEHIDIVSTTINSSLHRWSIK
jgi:hypothetical protein